MVDHPDDAEVELEALKRKIHADRGFNCHLYKDKCLRRRLAVRMRARGEQSFGAYAELLDRDPDEYDRLIDALTINVTKFFRNAETWDLIAERVIPPLFASGPEPLRVWSAGCATGEEPYSLAILMQEWATGTARERDLERVRILGTDIDRRSLEAAQQAEFPELSFDETSPQRRARWFSSGPPFRLHAAARQRVQFARQDLISDEPPGDLDLILCRNVIIYFDRATQERLFEKFLAALKPGGFLVLGRVETLLGRTRTAFQPLNVRERIYQKPA